MIVCLCFCQLTSNRERILHMSPCLLVFTIATYILSLVLFDKKDIVYFNCLLFQLEFTSIKASVLFLLTNLFKQLKHQDHVVHGLSANL